MSQDNTENHAKKKNRLERVYVLGVISVIVYCAARLQFAGLETKSIWYDEAFSLMFVRSSIGDLIQYCRNDILPPLYFMALYVWLKVLSPSTHIAINMYPRILSVLFGILSIPLLFILGKKLSNNAVGIISALFLAVSPFYHHYAQEIRMYSMFVALAIVLYIVAYEFIKRPALPAYALMVIISAALLYIHYITFYFLIGVAVLLFWRLSSVREQPALPLILRKPVLAVIKYAFVVGLLFSPWLMTFFYHSHLSYLVFASPPSSAVLSRIQNILLMLVTGFSPISLFPGQPSITFIFYGILVLLMLFFFVLGAISFRRYNPDVYVFFLSLFFIPLLLLVVHITYRSQFYERYFLPFLPLFLVVVAEGILQLKNRLLITVVLAALCVVMFACSIRSSKIDVRDVTRSTFNILYDTAEPNDMVVHISPKSFFPYKCYDIKNTYEQCILNSKEISIYDLNLILPGEMIDSPDEIPQDVNKIWFVYHIWKAGDVETDFRKAVTMLFLNRGWNISNYHHHGFGVKHLYLVLLQRVG